MTLPTLCVAWSLRPALILVLLRDFCQDSRHVQFRANVARVYCARVESARFDCAEN